jgi:cephalosporin hydroxylase
VLAFSKGYEMKAVHYHTDRAISVGEVCRDNAYLPNYEFANDSIDDFHEYLFGCPMKSILIDIGVQGWLRKADALKLYELAFFAPGDILEFGTNRGLSAYILANALKSSGRAGEIVTMELSGELSAAAKKTLESKGVADRVVFEVGDADVTCERLISEGRKFGFAFIDHSHAYEHMVKACQRLSQLMAPGSFCVFHDYNDARNTRRKDLGEVGDEYGVKAAIDESLDSKIFEFVGVYGCTGVYRRRDS